MPAADRARGLIVVGASAGGVEAMAEFVAGLPADLAACVLVVVHVPATGTSALPRILDRRGPLPARHAEDGEPLLDGQVLVAPPDHHLVVLGDRVSLTRGPTENGHRPAVDVLFRSAARAWGERVFALVLSGSLDDGAAGSVAIGQRGGRVGVQSDALFDGMPNATQLADDPETAAPVRELATWVSDWASGLADPVPEVALAPPHTDMQIDAEVEMSDMEPDAVHDLDRPGEPAGFGCPDCAGSLYRIEEESLTRFRCRVGHAWSPESLLVRQTVAMESALWMALRSLEEKAALNSELGQRASKEGRDQAAGRFDLGATDAMRAAELVRQLIVELGDVQDAEAI